MRTQKGMYEHAKEPNHTLRHQLIACYRTMWTMDQSQEFFHRGIMNKTGSSMH